MIRFLDYTYYIIWKFYNKYEKGAGFKAVLVLALLLAVNVLGIFFLYANYQHIKKPINNTQVVLLYFVVGILVLCRYNSKKHNFKVFDEQWSHDEPMVKHPKTIWVQLYVLFTVVFILTVTIYGGMHHNEYV